MVGRESGFRNFFFFFGHRRQMIAYPLHNGSHIGVSF